MHVPGAAGRLRLQLQLGVRALAACLDARRMQLNVALLDMGCAAAGKGPLVLA